MECVWRGEAYVQRGWAEVAWVRLTGTFPASNPIIGGENWVWCEGSTAGVRGRCATNGQRNAGGCYGGKDACCSVWRAATPYVSLILFLVSPDGADACCSKGVAYGVGMRCVEKV